MWPGSLTYLHGPHHMCCCSSPNLALHFLVRSEASNNNIKARLFAFSCFTNIILFHVVIKRGCGLDGGGGALAKW